jgi:hypothetical protein
VDDAQAAVAAGERQPRATFQRLDQRLGPEMLMDIDPQRPAILQNLDLFCEEYVGERPKIRTCS